MPPRVIGGQPGFPAGAIQPGEPERAVVYTFACTVGDTAGFEAGPRSETLVRQQLDPAVRSVTATAVSPDLALPLTPGSQQLFTVMADWEDNTFTPLSGKLRLSALDFSGHSGVTVSFWRWLGVDGGRRPVFVFLDHGLRRREFFFEFFEAPLEGVEAAGLFGLLLRHGSCRQQRAQQNDRQRRFGHC